MKTDTVKILQRKGEKNKFCQSFYYRELGHRFKTLLDLLLFLYNYYVQQLLFWVDGRRDAGPTLREAGAPLPSVGASLNFVITPLAIPQNTSSTCAPLFADVSKNGILYSSASAFPLLYGTARLLSSKSDLLPTNTLMTLSEACCSIFFIQFLMFAKDPSSETS